MSLAFKKTPIQDRAAMLARARHFFAEKNILEIDCPALVRKAPIDSHIDVIATDQDASFLHTSPEYALKRLLSAEFPDVYFLGHVYRKGEIGRLHNPEFTMAEWYRIGFSFDQMIDETCAFLQLFFGPLPIEKLDYMELFQKYKNVETNKDWSEQEQRHYLLTHFIEPELGKEGLCVVMHYPEEEAALARIVEKEGKKVAERFEVYFRGVELANGYHESNDAEGLRERFKEENRKRVGRSLGEYQFDEKFLGALENLPDCSGVALGFDRALMLKHGCSSLREIMPLSWEEL